MFCCYVVWYVYLIKELCDVISDFLFLVVCLMCVSFFLKFEILGYFFFIVLFRKWIKVNWLFIDLVEFNWKIENDVKY